MKLLLLLLLLLFKGIFVPNPCFSFVRTPGFREILFGKNCHKVANVHIQENCLTLVFEA